MDDCDPSSQRSTKVIVGQVGSISSKRGSLNPSQTTVYRQYIAQDRDLFTGHSTFSAWHSEHQMRAQTKRQSRRLCCISQDLELVALRRQSEHADSQARTSAALCSTCHSTMWLPAASIRSSSLRTPRRLAWQTFLTVCSTKCTAQTANVEIFHTFLLLPIHTRTSDT